MGPLASPPADPFDWLDSLGHRGVTPGLGRIAALCSRLGQPERRVPSVLVAGTNGKGSTAATLASILQAAGYRTAFYSSPHLVRITERLLLGGREVGRDRLGEALAEVRRVMDAGGEAADASWFEALTAAAFLVIGSEPLDVAVLEIGLGGRADATNLAPAILSVVTPLGLDHVEMLGGTLEAIAREKAGILKTGRPAVLAPQDPGAAAVLRRVADGVRAPVVELDPAAIEAVAVSVTGTRFRFAGPFGRQELETPLAGRHQAANAALAVLAAGTLAAAGFDRIDADVVGRGVAATRWAGRLDRRVAAGGEWIVDGCHNPHGAAACGAFLDEAGLSRRVTLVLGVLGDKDAEGIARSLATRAASVVVTRAPGERGRPAAELAEAVRRAAPSVPLAVEESPAAALALARARAGRGVVLVAGSLMLAGAALEWLEARG